jgi:hypothetical protein
MWSVVALTATLLATQASVPIASDIDDDDEEVAGVAPPSEIEEIGSATASRPTKSPVLRTFSQSAFILALQSIYYWRRPSLAGAESGTTWDSWKTKLFSTGEIKFDQDRYDTNASLHPIMGAIYYQIGRGNGLGVGGSLLTSFLASTTWEYTSEFIERPSLNDLILTPAVGTVIGEASFRLGRLFAAGRPGPVNCFGAVLFSPVATLNDTYVCGGSRGASSSGSAPYDGLGFSRRAWHRIDAGVAVGRSVFDGVVQYDATRYAIAAAVVTHTRYRRAGRDTSLVGPGQWSSIGGGQAFGNDRVLAIDFHADTSLVGAYLRRYADAGGGRQADGSGLLLGAGSSFDYDLRALPMGRDRIASWGLAGPKLEWSARRGWLAVTAALNAQYAFALVQSLAYLEAQAYLPEEFVKSPLRKEGYYYAHGAVSSAVVALALARFDLVAAARGGWYWSINARDQRQDDILKDFTLSDTRIQLHGEAAVRMLADSVRLAVAFDRIERASSLPGMHVATDERRAGLEARFIF